MSFWMIVGLVCSHVLVACVALLVGANNSKLVERERDELLAEAEAHLARLEGQARTAMSLWIARLREKWGL